MPVQEAPLGVVGSGSDDDGEGVGRTRGLMVGAATDDTITHAPLLQSALAYQWLYHNGPYFGYYLNMKKTITLLPYVIAAMHREVDMKHASMLTRPPDYEAMREVLDHLGYTEDD